MRAATCSAGVSRSCGIPDPIQRGERRAPVLAGDLDDRLLDPAQRPQPRRVALRPGVVEHRERLVQAVQGQGRPGQGDQQPGAGRHPLLVIQSLRQHEGTPEGAFGVTEPADLVEVPRRASSSATW